MSTILIPTCQEGIMREYIYPIQDIQLTDREWKIPSSRTVEVITLWGKLTVVQRNHMQKLIPIMNEIVNFYYELLFLYNKTPTMKIPKMRWLLNCKNRKMILTRLRQKYGYIPTRLINETENLFLFEHATLFDMLNKNQSSIWKEVFTSTEIMVRSKNEKRRIQFNNSFPANRPCIPLTKNYVYIYPLGWVKISPCVPQVTGNFKRMTYGYEQGRFVIDLIKDTVDTLTYDEVMFKFPKGLIEQVSTIIGTAFDIEILLPQLLSKVVLSVLNYPHISSHIGMDMDDYEEFPIYIQPQSACGKRWSMFNLEEREKSNIKLIQKLHQIIKQSDIKLTSSKFNLDDIAEI